MNTVCNAERRKCSIDLPPLATLSLNGQRHYVLPNRIIVPSVTTLLGKSNQRGLNAWRNRVGFDEAKRIGEEAASRGTSYHEFIDSYFNNTLSYDPLVGAYYDGKGRCSNKDITQKISTTIPFLEKVNCVYHQEVCLYSESLGTAGRCDLIAELDGKAYIIDFKTSKKPKQWRWISNYFEQATAYSLMYEELTGMSIPEIAIVIVNDEDPQQLQIFYERRERYVDSLQEKILAYDPS